MNDRIINFNLGFKHSGLVSGKKNILSTIDQYLDSLEEICQILARHFGYILDGSRRLKNISSEIFEYKLIPPLQLFLDNQITMEKMTVWIGAVVGFLISSTLESVDENIDLLARKAALDRSFFYVSLPPGLISRKVEKFRDLAKNLEENPTVITNINTP